MVSISCTDRQGGMGGWGVFWHGGLPSKNHLMEHKISLAGGAQYEILFIEPGMPSGAPAGRYCAGGVCVSTGTVLEVCV